ncbi:MAG: OmpH family outer membrane protein [Bacteroidales bacterium]|nr:OmpH family outer membrane protein [Bacteroidales bacterium]
MKNKLLDIIVAIIAFVCLVNLIMLIVLIKKNRSEKKFSDTKTIILAPSDSTNAIGFNIAVIDVDSLLRNYKFYKELESKLILKQKSLEADLQKQMANFEKEVQDFQRKAQTGSFISQESAKMQEQALYEKQQDLINKRDEYSKQMIEEHQKVEKQLYDTIISVLKAYNYDKKYSVIINKSSLLIASDYLEITDTVLQILNDRYDKWAIKRK